MNISETIKALPDDAECCVIRYTGDRIEPFADAPDLKALAAELKELRRIIAFYGIEIMPDGSFTSPRITQNEVDVKELREFVGAIDRVLIDGQECWEQDGAFWFFDENGEGIASGTDPADAYRNMKVGEGK